jgi:anthranilate phosphoribosyltransferase
VTLAPFVQILGRGPGRSRSLTRDEARAAMGVILGGEAAPEAVGALLMLLRMKGETAEELAGFVEAARGSLDWQGPKPALDWPSYAAGRTRGLPWFLLSARLVARAGYPVLLHGWNGMLESGTAVRGGVADLGIPLVRDAEGAGQALARDGIAYLPLEDLSPRLFALLRLREVLGLRSCINTVLRMLNPGGAAASVQGVFHPSYREIQADAGLLLGQASQTVIKGGGGEFECHPGKDLAAFGLRCGAVWERTYPANLDVTRRLADEDAPPERVAALWAGEWREEFAEAVVLRTAALALDTLEVARPEEVARTLWTGRHDAKAA